MKIYIRIEPESEIEQRDAIQIGKVSIVRFTRLVPEPLLRYITAYYYLVVDKGKELDGGGIEFIDDTPDDESEPSLN